MKKQNRSGFTLIELMIVIAIIGILAAIAIPNFRRARAQAREKACYANMRVILGAVEMYNMDHTSMMDSVDAGQLSTLASLKYLRRVPEYPTTKCSYKGTSMEDGGLIHCDFHGTVENSAK